MARHYERDQENTGECKEIMKNRALNGGEPIVVKLSEVDLFNDKFPEGKKVKRYCIKERCCDCGLVHDVFIAEDNGKGIIVQWYVNKRATAQTRRRKKEIGNDK